MTEHETQLLTQALNIIVECERALGRKLCQGEKRDLLKDNTEWHGLVCDLSVAQLAELGWSPFVAFDPNA